MSSNLTGPAKKSLIIRWLIFIPDDLQILGLRFCPLGIAGRKDGTRTNQASPALRHSSAVTPVYWLLGQQPGQHSIRCRSFKRIAAVNAVFAAKIQLILCG
ncbi:MAG: hypothetical protein U0989_11825 [Azonexus sp.]|nr:hypothetical protein [Azonexus sp.]MDZ4315436.1 hypothetical protein [Azonexus sp.]